MFRTHTSIALLAALITLVASLPAPQPQTTTGPHIVGGECHEQTSSYTVLSQNPVLATPVLVTGSTWEAGPEGKHSLNHPHISGP